MEDCKDVSWNGYFTCAAGVIPFESYSAEFFPCPIFVYTFVLCSENVTDMSCMFSPYTLDTEIINDKSKHNRACMVAP